MTKKRRAADRTFAERLGERIRTMRKLQGLSMLQLAARSGGLIGPELIGIYERGRSEPSLSRFLILLSILGCSVDDLLPGVLKRIHDPDALRSIVPE